MDYRVLTEAERKYTFSQSQQLSMQTGLIGYLRADFGSNGNEFWTTWNDFRKDLKTDEFKAEFDDVINGLRDGDVLSGRKAMSSYCYSTPDSSFNDDRKPSSAPCRCRHRHYPPQYLHRKYGRSPKSVPGFHPYAESRQRKDSLLHRASLSRRLCISRR